MSILRTHSNAARQSEDDPTVTGSNKAADLRARFGQSAETPKTEPPRAPETEIEPAVTPRAASPTVMSGATMPALFEGGYDLPPTRVSGTMLQGDRIAVEGADRIVIASSGIPLDLSVEYCCGRPQKAYNLWQDGGLADQVVYAPGAPWPPTPDRLKASLADYTPTSYLYLVCLQNGVMYTYAPGGFYGPAAVDELVDRIIVRWQGDPAYLHAWPIGLLSGRRHPTRDFGVKWALGVQITGWSLPDKTRLPA